MIREILCFSRSTFDFFPLSRAFIVPCPSIPDWSPWEPSSPHSPLVQSLGLTHWGPVDHCIIWASLLYLRPWSHSSNVAWVPNSQKRLSPEKKCIVFMCPGLSVLQIAVAVTTGGCMLILVCEKTQIGGLFWENPLSTLKPLQFVFPVSESPEVFSTASDTVHYSDLHILPNLSAGKGSFKSLLEGHDSLQGTQTVTGTKEPETQKFMGRSLLSVQCASPEQPRKEALVQTCGLHCMQKQRHSCGLCTAAAAPICCMGEKGGTNQVTCSRSSDIEEGPFMLPWELVRWVLIQVGIKIIQVGRRNFNLKIKPLLKPDNENNIMSQNWASYLLLCGNGQIYTECLPERELNLKPFLDFFQIQFWENEVLQFFKSL